MHICACGDEGERPPGEPISAYNTPTTFSPLAFCWPSTHGWQHRLKQTKQDHMPAHKARCYIPCTKAQAATKRKGWHTLKGSTRCTVKPGRTRSYASGGNPQRRHLYTSSGSPLSMDPARHPVQYRWPHKATATSDTKTAPSSRFATSSPHRVQRNNSGPPVI